MLWTFRLGGRLLLGETPELAGSSRTMSILPLSETSCLAHHWGVTTSTILQRFASGPNSHLTAVERRQRREAIRSLRLQTDGSARRPKTLLLIERSFPHRLTPRLNRRWSRAVSRLLAPALDRKLAEGRSPESHLLLAARSQVLVSPVKRRTLAQNWADLLAQARTPTGPRDPRAPINRNSILSHESDIRALLAGLAAPTAGHVRGIALLSWLLADGTGPLYNRHPADELAGLLREATALLDCPVI